MDMFSKYMAIIGVVVGSSSESLHKHQMLKKFFGNIGNHMVQTVPLFARTDKIPQRNIIYTFKATKSQANISHIFRSHFLMKALTVWF